MTANGRVLTLKKSDSAGTPLYQETYSYNDAPSIVTTFHVWDGSNLAAEVDAGGQIKARYLRGVNLIAREAEERRSC